MPDASGHRGEHCPFVGLVTPDVVSRIEDAIDIVRRAGHSELSDHLDAWLVRVTHVVTAVSEDGSCSDGCHSEVWVG